MAKTTDRSRVLVVDDHPIVRGGLIRLLDQQADLVCCGEAATAAEALALATREKPDLAIIDLRLKHGDGLELIKAIKAARPAIRCLVLSQHSEEIYVERALRAGALGYVMKEQPPEELLYAIRTILQDEVYLNPGMTEHFLRHVVTGSATAPRAGIEQLTDRELCVLQLLAEGKATRDIAVSLGVSPKTIETHRENIKHKLGLKGAAELVRFAVQWASRETGPDSSRNDL